MMQRVSKRSAAALLGLSLVLGSSGSGCTADSHAEGTHHGGGDYPMTRPLVQDIDLTQPYVAQIHAIQHIEVRALERGYLEGIFIDEGKPVASGERMFQIMPQIVSAEMRKAAAEAEFAGIEYETTRSLQEGNVVSPSELALAKARKDKAEAELSLAKVHLGLTEVRAPFDGIMGRLEVRKGSLVDEGELLTTLSDNSQMWVYFNVSEAEYLDYRKHMKAHDLPVKLQLANGDVFEHEGVVETIAADFNNETGNIAFRATFPNPEGLLRHGETGRVLVSTPVKEALVIPQKATFDILDKKYVYVIDEEHVVHAREIEVLHELPHVYVVGEGLSVQDEILLEGLRHVRDGHEVHVHFEEPESVLAKLEVPAE